MKKFWGNNLQRICLGIAVIIVGAFIINYFSEKSIAKRNIEDYLSRNVNDFSYYEPVEYGNLHPVYNLFGYSFKDSIRYNNKSLGFELNDDAPELLTRDGFYFLKSRSGEMNIADKDSKLNYFEDSNGNLGVWIAITSRKIRNVNYDDCVYNGQKRIDELVKNHIKNRKKRYKSNHMAVLDIDWWLLSEAARFHPEVECGEEFFETNPFMAFNKKFIKLSNKYPLSENSKITKPTLSYTLYHTFRLNNDDGNKVLFKSTFCLNDKFEVTSSISR